MSTPSNIAVIGCGPAGLAAALLLHREGHRVTIYERFEAPRPLGSGLMLQPSGMAVIDRLGLAQEIAQRGARIDRLYGLNERARVALDAPYARLGMAGAFGIGIHRASLFDVLFAAVIGEAIPVETGCEVHGVEAQGDRRCLRFANGRHSAPHDLVVDASGWASNWASRLGEDGPVSLLPFGALWASLPLEAGDPLARNMLEQRYRRASQMVGVLPIGARAAGAPQEAAFFWSLRGQDHEAWRAAPLDRWKDEVRALWPETDYLLARITSHDELTFARYAHRTAPRSRDPRLIRIGDAWHCASPQLGQGANMALLDAYALASGFRHSRGIEGALRLARGWRSEHVWLYQLVTASFTPMFQSDAAIWPTLRDYVLAPLSRIAPVARLQAQLMSGLFGWPLAVLGLDLPDYGAVAAAMASRAGAPDQSYSPVTRQTSRPVSS